MKTLEELNLVDDFLVKQPDQPQNLWGTVGEIHFGMYSASADRKAYGSATTFLLRREYRDSRHSAGCISG